MTIHKQLLLLINSRLLDLVEDIFQIFGGYWVTTAAELSRLRAENAEMRERIETLTRTVGERDKTIEEMGIETENLNSLFGIAVRNPPPAPCSAAVDAMAARMVVEDMRSLKSAGLWRINGRAADIYSGGLDIYLSIR